MTNKTPKAVFLDRDGTLIRDKNYLSRVEDIEYYADTFTALHLLRTKGYMLFVITNQSGINRGFFTWETVEAIHKVIDEDMTAQKLGPFTDWGICPHTPDEGCLCRKPAPTLIKDFIYEYGINAAESWMVGDKTIDAECGVNAGIKGAVVREKQNAGTHPYFDTLLAFAQSL